MPIVTRFAPSPTGPLHLGSAHAALFAWHRARDAGGRFLLRIEDIDTQRCRPEHAAGIEADLAWLGLDWDGPVRVQSRHLAEYDKVVGALAARGLAYRCTCTRADAAAAASAPHGLEGPIYPGTCRDRPPPPGARHAWRLDMAKALAWASAGAGPGLEAATAFGDVVIARRETPASYHLCVTHDDAAQGVTLVTRAEDLAPAVPLHRLLQRLMGWPEPDYEHHRLLADSQGRRLTKRDHAVGIGQLRDGGATPADVRALAGFADAAPRAGG